ncbi:MAG: ion channel [Geminicoccaceae bacterium]
MLEPTEDLGRLRIILRQLFYGHRPSSVAFQAGLLALDFAAIGYFLATTFIAEAPWMRLVDFSLGVLLLLEFLGRMAAHRQPMAYLDNASAMIDLAVITSLFVGFLLGDNLAFLRVLRTVRLLRSYNVLGQLKRRFAVVRRHEDILKAALDLIVFMLLVASVVYVTQHAANPEIADFLDALYFTVVTLTTTGFGDITLVGTGGRLLSIAIMLIGISLFFRLAQAVFRPGGKVRHPCPRCGLQRHDADAVHCKACGLLLNIPDEEI